MAADTRKWAGVVAAFVLLMPGCAREHSSTSKTDGHQRVARARSTEKTEERPKVKAIVEQVTLRWQEGDEPRLVAKASRLVGNELTGKGSLDDVSAELYRNGRKTTLLQAPHVNASRRTGTLTASGGAVVKSIEQGTVVRCPNIEWHANEQRIIGSGGVTVESKNGRVNAESFVADTELRTIEFQAGPSGGSAVIGSGEKGVRATRATGK